MQMCVALSICPIYTSLSLCLYSHRFILTMSNLAASHSSELKLFLFEAVSDTCSFSHCSELLPVLLPYHSHMKDSLHKNIKTLCHPPNHKYYSSISLVLYSVSGTCYVPNKNVGQTKACILPISQKAYDISIAIHRKDLYMELEKQISTCKLLLERGRCGA